MGSALSTNNSKEGWPNLNVLELKFCLCHSSISEVISSCIAHYPEKGRFPFNPIKVLCTHYKMLIF